MIELSNIEKTHRDGRVGTVALDGINLSLEPGSFNAVVGPSGSGKTTLLSVLGLLSTADSGSYSFRAVETVGLSQKERFELRKKHIAFIFQHFNLIDGMSVTDNVQLGVKFHPYTKQEMKERTNSAIEQVKMDHRSNSLVSALSGGQKQRVAIARAICSSPDLLLADEPTGNLDSKNSEQVLQLLEKIHSDGRTIVMVTHSPSEAERATRTIKMFDGQIASDS